MSTQKIPVTFLNGYSPRKGVLGIIAFPDMLKADTTFTRLFTYSNGQWGRGDDFPFDCRSLSYLADAATGYKAWWLLGKNGEAVEIKAGVPTIDQIPGAGLNVAHPYGYVSAIKNIQGKLYVCGYGRQVYRRDPPWRSIADDILTHESAIGFFDIDGASDACIYAVGWQGEIYFREGQVWRKDDSPTTAHLAGVRCIAPDDVWICGDKGVVLHGSFNNWREIRDPGFTGNWYSIEEFGGRIYLAANEGLAWVDGNAIRPVDVGLKRPITTHRLQARDGLLWSIGEKDILMFDGQVWKEALHPDNV